MRAGYHLSYHPRATNSFLETGDGARATMAAVVAKRQKSDDPPYDAGDDGGEDDDDGDDDGEEEDNGEDDEEEPPPPGPSDSDAPGADLSKEITTLPGP